MGEVLGRAEGARYIHEPDDERRDPQALRARLRHRSFPELSESEPPDSHPAYRDLWQGVFAGGVPSSHLRARAARRVLRSIPREDINALGEPGTSPSARVRLVAALATPRQGPRPEVVIAKTVRALRSVEWLARHFGPSVLIVTRHPLDVLASRLDLGWGVSQDAPLPPPGSSATSELQQMAWQIGSFGGGLAAAAARHPAWEVVRHEDLCRAPEDGFRHLCDRFHLRWTDAQQEFLGAANRPGEGWEVQRIAADQPDRWKERLTGTQIETATRVIESLPGAFDGYR